MSSTAASRRTSRVLATVAALLLTLSGAVTSPAPAANTAPVRVEIDSITSDVVPPSGLPTGAAPYLLVKAGGTFTIKVSFYDAADQPASFTKNTTLTVATSVGTLKQTEGVALKGNESAYIATSLTAPVNQVVLTVSAGSGPKAPTPGTSYDPLVPDGSDLRFDVLTDVSSLLPGKDGDAFQEGFGGKNGCAEATETAPVCEIVVLPRGAGSKVLLSVGACDAYKGATYAPCHTGSGGTVGGAVPQALFAQPSDPADAYKPESPATIIVRCDKTLCGGGPIRNLSVLWSYSGTGDLGADGHRAAPCPAKGTMATAHTPCVDYVQSKRDGSGDTHLYLLTDGDIRTGIG